MNIDWDSTIANEKYRKPFYTKAICVLNNLKCENGGMVGTEHDEEECKECCFSHHCYYSSEISFDEMSAIINTAAESIVIRINGIKYLEKRVALKKEIELMKRAAHGFLNDDYKKGYMSALSHLEGWLAKEIDSDDYRKHNRED